MGVASTSRNEEGFSIVISFSVLEARNQLLKNGVVYTFRWARRSHFKKKKGPIENTWAASKRTGPKIADVVIEEIDRIPPEIEYLEPFVDQSGFPSSQSWLAKIYGLVNPDQINSHGYIYRVTRKSQQLRKDQNE